MVRSSRVLIGAHGAGLAHLFFLHPSASVLELSVPRYAARINYGHMARSFDLTYNMAMLEGSAENFADQSFYVDTKDFVTLLNMHLPKRVPRGQAQAQAQ